MAFYTSLGESYGSGSLAAHILKQGTSNAHPQNTHTHSLSPNSSNHQQVPSSFPFLLCHLVSPSQSEQHCMAVRAPPTHEDSQHGRQQPTAPTKNKTNWLRHV